MRNRLMFAAPALALAATLMAAPAARAEFFEYNGTVTINPISGITGVAGNNTTSAVLTTTGGETITVSALSSLGDPHENALPPLGTDIVFGDVNVATTVNTTFQNVQFGFTYSLTFTDFNQPSGGVASGTGTILVSGVLGGSIGAGRKVNLDQLSAYTTVPASGLFTAGNDLYRLTLNPFTPPGANNSGRFGANVVAIPEPASVVSMALGLVGVAGLAARRNRRKVATA